MDALFIRPATPADIPAARTLIESAYRGDDARQGWTHEADLLGGQRIDEDGLARLIADPQEHLLLGFDGSRMVATVNVSNKDGPYAYLGLLSVDPRLQTGGHGRRMIAAAEDKAREIGCRFIEMTVIRQRSELIAYYVRRGYHLTGETRPFPYDDEKFGLPNRPDLIFEVLEKALYPDED